MQIRFAGSCSRSERLTGKSSQPLPKQQAQTSPSEHIHSLIHYQFGRSTDTATIKLHLIAVDYTRFFFHPLHNHHSRSYAMSRYSVEIPGHYTWQLLFSMDMDDGGHFKQTVEKTFERSISVKTFREHIVQKLQAKGVKIAKEVGASSIFRVVSVSAKGSNQFSHHKERLEKLTTSSSSQEDIKESVTIRTDFEVKPGEKLSVYALQFDLPGFHDVYDVLSSDPVNVDVPFEVVVEAAFPWRDSLLKLAQCLANTHPWEDNKVEWNKIRTSLLDNVLPIATTDPASALKNMLTVLKTIFPGSDNKVEWDSIRSVAQDSLERIERGELTKAFRNIVDQLRHTHPGRDNTIEWTEIRAVSDEVWRNV